MPINQLYRTREISRTTCLRHFAGRASIMSGVFDATTLAAQNLTNPLQYVNIYGAALQTVQAFFVPIGSFLTKSTTDPTKIKVYQGLGTNQNDVQTLTVSGVPTGGSFTLSWNGQTTAAIAFNASAAAVAAAIGALSNVGTPNIAGTGGPLPGSSVTLTFQNLLGNANQPVITVATNSLTGGTTPAPSIVHTTPGTTAETIIGVFDGPDRDFFGNVVAADEAVPIYYHSCVFDVSKLQNWPQFGVAAKAALPTCEFF